MAANLRLVLKRREGALECGGLTPPWDRRGTPSRYKGRKGGVKPPHSKAPSVQAFSKQSE